MNIFRLLHTVKGTCGFLGLPRLEAAAHAGENILGKFRDQELEVTPDAVTLILQSLDCIKGILEVLSNTGAEPEGNDADLIARLNAMAEGGSAAPQTATEDGLPEFGLLEQAGGASGIDAIVDLLYRRIAADGILNVFFEGVDLDLLQGDQRALFEHLLGGPSPYDMGNLTSTFAPIVSAVLNEPISTSSAVI